MTIKKVQLVLHPDQQGWILHKIAQKIKNELERLGVEVSIVDNPEGEADVYFWLYFGHRGITQHAGDSNFTGIRSAFVTHVDDLTKTAKISNLLRNNVDLVFMSKEHAQTIADGFGRTQFFNILLGSDLSNYNDPYRIGIFSKRFSDGRKNEKWLLRLAKEIELPDVEFTFVGSGWGDVASKLNALGVKTKRFDGEQHQYPEYSDFPSIYKSVDLFLSPSFDEGSMGSLDAFILGIDMLISRHGFHCELNLKEENYLDNYDDFKLKIENRLETFRTRRNEAKKWNWGRTAETLLSHWQSLEENGENRQRAIGNSANGRLNWKVKKRYLSRSIYRLVKINFVERVSNRIKRIFN